MGMMRALSLALILVAAGTEAQEFPQRPIRLVVPFAPGGGVDAVGRTIAQNMSETLGQPILVDNRGGAGGNIGTELVARAAADGYTLLLTTNGHSIQPNLQKLDWDPVKSFAPIGLVLRFSFIVVTHPSVPAANPSELLAYARANPGKLAYGSSGTGGPIHLGMEMLKRMQNVDIVHVPYKGNGPMTAALIGGEVQMTMDSMAVSLPQVRAGKLRGIAVTGRQRAPQAPELPTMTEGGVAGYEYEGWHGVLAPAGTPREIVARLSAALIRALGAAEVKSRLFALGYDATPTSSEAFATLIAADSVRFGRIVREAGIKSE